MPEDWPVKSDCNSKRVMGRSWRGVWFWLENVEETLFTGATSKLQKKFFHCEDVHTGPILESKGICAIFQKKGKIFENLGKNVKKLKIFWKKGSLMHATIACMKQLEYALLVNVPRPIRTSSTSLIEIFLIIIRNNRWCILR